MVKVELISAKDRLDSKTFLKSVGLDIDHLDAVDPYDVHIQPMNEFSRRLLFHIGRVSTASQARKFLLLFIGESHRMEDEECFPRQTISNKLISLTNRYNTVLKKKDENPNCGEEFLDGTEDIEKWGYKSEESEPSTSKAPRKRKPKVEATFHEEEEEEEEAIDEEFDAPYEDDDEVDDLGDPFTKQTPREPSAKRSRGSGNSRGRPRIDDDLLRIDRINSRRHIQRQAVRIEALKAELSSIKAENKKLLRATCKPSAENIKVEHAELARENKKLKEQLEKLKTELKTANVSLKTSQTELEKATERLSNAMGGVVQMKQGGRFADEVHDCVLKLKTQKIPNERIGAVMEAVATMCGKTLSEVPSARTVGRDMKIAEKSGVLVQHQHDTHENYQAEDNDERLMVMVEGFQQRIGEQEVVEYVQHSSGTMYRRC